MKRLLILIPFMIFMASCEREALLEMESDSVQSTQNTNQLNNNSQLIPDIFFDLAQGDCCSRFGNPDLEFRELIVTMGPDEEIQSSTLLYFYVEENDDWILQFKTAPTGEVSVFCVPPKEYRVIAINGCCPISEIVWNDTCTDPEVTLNEDCLIDIYELECTFEGLECINLESCLPTGTLNIPTN